MFGKNKKNKWFKIANKLYYKGKLSSPYETLFKYYKNVNLGLSGASGHFDYFRYYDGVTGKAVNDLQAVLSEDLFENFLKAFESYKGLGNDPEYESIEHALGKFDYYAFDHIEEIEDILRNYFENL